MQWCPRRFPLGIMPTISADDFFNADELPAEAELSGAALSAAFWKLKRLQREFQQQQLFWKSVDDSMSSAYAKLAALQEISASRARLLEANAELEQEVKERAAEVSAARELAENVIASISDMLLVIGTDGIIKQANRAACEMLERNEDEIVGRSIQDIIVRSPTPDADLPDDWLDVIMRGGEIRNRKVACTTPSGRSISVVFSAAGLRGPEGEVLGLVSTAKDVTEQKRAEEELLRHLSQITAQQETIRALITPIIRVWDRVLVLPLVGALDQGRASEITHSLLHSVSDTQSAFVVIDLTGVTAVDTETAEHLLKISRAVGLLGARCLICGLSAPAARAFISLDINLRDLASFGNLHSALRHALLQMNDLPRGT
jgi:PAS domain S-box-containing protein